MPAKKTDDIKSTETKVTETTTPPAVEPTPAVTETPAPEVVKEEVKKAEPKVEETPITQVKAKTSTTSENTEQDSLETEQVVVFQLENEEYAAPILDVQEIIPTGDITPFPNVANYIAGIINVRGTVATVINLASRFNLSRTSAEGKDKYIILTNVNKNLFGIMVDDVTSVMKIPTNKIKPASNAESKVQTEYIDKVAVIDQRIILILDFKKVLGEEAIVAAGEASQG